MYQTKVVGFSYLKIKMGVLLWYVSTKHEEEHRNKVDYFSRELVIVRILMEVIEVSELLRLTGLVYVLSLYLFLMMTLIGATWQVQLPRLPDLVSRAMPYLFSLAAFCLFGSYSLVDHYTFHSNAWDLGGFSQSVWKLSQVRWPSNTIFEINSFGDHFSVRFGFDRAPLPDLD